MAFGDRRARLGNGRKSLERGSTFANRGDGLRRTEGLKRSGPKRNAAGKRPRRHLVSAASLEQRAKVKDALSIVSGREGCDPAHVVPRSLGGCDSPLCVVPITRAEHERYEVGDLDLLPYMVRARCIPELQHALAHVDGSLLRLTHIVTGKRHVPESP